MVVEDAARDLEQLPDGRIWQCVPNRQPLLLGRHDAPVSQNGELLRHNRLVQLQRFLQFLNGAIAADEDLEDLDADRMCQRPKKLSFEELERARWHRSLPSYRPQRPRNGSPFTGRTPSASSGALSQVHYYISI